jgi:hypothetical protein
MLTRITLVAIISLSTLVRGESYLFTIPQPPDLKEAKIEGGHLHISVPLLRLPNPDVGGVEVNRSEDDGFVVRTYIKEVPERGWFPMLKLEDEIIELSKVTNNGPNFASYFEIVFKERKEAVAVARSLAALFAVPEGRLAIGEEEEAQQGGTGQPATRPAVEPEGGDKPQPEAKGRSR